IPREFFNDCVWTSTGPLNANFEFRPSIAVNASQCPSGSWIQARLEYTAAITEDCNANGLLDVCEVRDYPETDLNGNGICDACEGQRGSPWCAGDLDSDGEVAASDIGMLLIRFGMSMPGDPADLDGDGEVSASDIGTLLLLFGPC
ncbi:MAG: dockerin type I domain-containing protein, partial [Planctomycetota bacterium]